MNGVGLVGHNHIVFYRSGTHRLATDYDFSRKSWSHTGTGQLLLLTPCLGRQVLSAAARRTRGTGNIRREEKNAGRMCTVHGSFS